MRRRTKLACISAVLGGWALLSACGPIVSGVGILNANVEISASETAGARQFAIYEYTSAVEYLQKAREEHGYSDFAAARKYADKSHEFAVKARKKASAHTQAEQPVMLPPP